MCSRDYFEYVPPPRARNLADYELVCPTAEEQHRKNLKNYTEMMRLRRENERLLYILEKVSGRTENLP